ncbi:MAG: LamG domain-containing protein [bacterium]
MRGLGTAGQGYDGASGGGQWYPGGGGGAGAAGQSNPGHGGAGMLCSILGTAYYWGGGGGGGGYTGNGGSGGAGGGGGGAVGTTAGGSGYNNGAAGPGGSTGGAGPNMPGGYGGANTGGGGGGGSYDNGTLVPYTNFGGSGGSGIVIVRYSTRGVPWVNTLPPTSVSWTSASLNGTLSTNGADAATVRVYWGTNNAGTNAASWQYTNEAPSAFSTGSDLATNVTLTPGASYYCRYYATNAYGDSWSSTSVFFTAMPPAGVLAQGGSSTNDVNGYRIHVFTNSGTFIGLPSVNADVLVVAGGGGGGSRMGGGGGGGGVIYTSIVMSDSAYPVTVGAGGAGAPAGASSSRGSTGGNSAFGTLLAFGGGGGGSDYGTSNNASGNNAAGSGGSGGGSAGASNPNAGSGIAGQGYAGGSGGGNYYPGGGGGAGGPGRNTPGHGGTGVVCSILGPAYYWGGGGGGSGYTGSGGNGGPGGGGGGAVGNTVGGSGLNAGQPGGGGQTVAQCNRPGGNGGANTGGGGGGGSHNDANNQGGNGGSGIVVVRYALPALPVTGNLAATNVTSTGANLNGILFTNGASSAAVRLFWGDTDGGTNAGGWQNTNEFGVFSTGSTLTTNVTLASGALYYYRYYASNDHGEIWAPSTALVLARPGMYGTGGGVTNELAGYRIHVFTNSGTFTLFNGGNVEALVVAGGGGGGSDMGGGGGGGGVVYTSSLSLADGGVFAVTVGGGGAGAPAGTGQVRGYNGSNSVFYTLCAIGGGGGASTHNNYNSPAGDGGSGGGCSGDGGTVDTSYPNGSGGARGLGTPGQGYAGGAGGTRWYPGGGGGAGGAGIGGNVGSPPHGGTGVECSILGTSYYWGGGGGGSSYSISPGGNGGLGGGGGGAVGATVGGAGYNNGSAGGGGTAASQCNTPGGNAGANTGGGGGGGSHYSSNNKGGNGGAGIVVIRYLTGAPAIMNAGASNVTTTAADLNGVLLTNGMESATVRLYWGTTDAGAVAGNWQYTNEFTGPLADGLLLTTNIAGLWPQTAYYYRYYAGNSAGGTWADTTASFFTRSMVEPKRMRISFPAYSGQSETLTNFPVLVVLSNNVGNSGFDFSAFDTGSGHDLRFVTNLDDTASLDYEIESWNTNADGASYVWVRMPILPPDGNGYVWAKWGDDTTQLPCTTNGSVWNSGFAAVWHMNDTNQAGYVTDGTANRNHATRNGTAPTNAAGRIAGAQGFTNGYLEAADSASLDLSADRHTMEAWVYGTTLAGDYRCVVGKIAWANTDWTYNTHVGWTDPNSFLHQNVYNASVDQTLNTANGSLVAGQWYYVTATYDRTLSSANQVSYINGAQRASRSTTVVVPANAQPVRIGAWYSGDPNYFIGYIDEVRLSSVARSSNWVWSCWMGQVSNTVFNSYGPMQAVSNAWFVWPGVSNETVDSAAGYVTLLTSNADVYLVWDLTNRFDTLAGWAGTNYVGADVATGRIDDVAMSNLASGAIYYCRFFATNTANGATEWSTAVRFGTLGPPTVTTLAATNILKGSAWLDGSLVITGGAPTTVRVYWGSSDAYPSHSGWLGTNDFGVSAAGLLTCKAHGLAAGQTYYFRYYATNSYGESWGSVASFTTAAGTPDGIWDGEGNPVCNWSLGLNWTDDLTPGNPATGTLTFNNTGIARGRNLVDASWQVGGLTYANTVGIYTTALAGNALTVNSSLQVGNNTRASAVIEGSAGIMQVGTPSARGNIYVGYQSGGNGTLVQAGGLFVAYVNDLLVGRSVGNTYGTVPGTLDLSAVDNGTLDVANNFIVGRKYGNGVLRLGNNWTVRVGTSSAWAGAFYVGAWEYQDTYDAGYVAAGSGGSLAIYAGSVNIGTSGYKTGASGTANFGGMTGPVVLNANSLSIGTAGGQASGYGTLDLRSTTNLAFNVGTVVMGTPENDYGHGAIGTLFLGAGTGTVGAITLGDSRYSSGTPSSIVTYGTRLKLTTSLTMNLLSSVTNYIGSTPGGWDIVNTNKGALSIHGSSTIAAGRGLSLSFTANPSGYVHYTADSSEANGVHWGLRWAGNHTNELTNLWYGADGIQGSTDDRLRWDASALSGEFAGKAGILYDAGLGTDGRPLDMTYIGFYVKVPTNLEIQNGSAPAGANLSPTQATVTATVITNGGSAATGYIFYDTVDRGPSMAWAFTNELGELPSSGPVSTTLSGLTGNTVYYFMAYATNAAGQSAWGGSTGVQFNTACLPSVTTLAASNAQATSAWLNGNLTETGGGTALAVRVYWGTSDSYPSYTAWSGTNDFGAVGVGLLAHQATGLSGSTVYYYRYYATNEYGEDWGGVVNFVPGTTGNLTWDGGPVSGSDNWSAGTNWVGDITPAAPTPGTLTFNDTGIAHSNNVMNLDWQVGGLTYANSSSRYETDLGGRTLTVAGTLTGSGNARINGAGGGRLQIGNTGARRTATVSGSLTQTNGAFSGVLTDLTVSGGAAVMDLSTVTGGTLDIADNFVVGYGGNSFGTLSLGSNWAIRVGSGPYARAVVRVGNGAWYSNSGTVTARSGGGSLTVYASSFLAGYTLDGNGACSGSMDFGGITGPVLFDATSMVLGYNNYGNWGGGGYGILNLSGTTNLTFNAGTLTMGYDDWGGTADQLLLGAGTGTVVTAVIGHAGVNSPSPAILVTHGTDMRVVTSLTLNNMGAVSNNIGIASAGLNVLASDAGALAVAAGSTTAAGRGIKIVFGRNPAYLRRYTSDAGAADGVHWGLRWKGDHVAALQSLAAAGNLWWNQAGLTGEYSNNVALFYDAGLGTAGRPNDMTYVGFYTKTETNLTIWNGPAPSGFSLWTTQALVTVDVVTNGGVPASGYVFYDTVDHGANLTWGFTNSLGILNPGTTVPSMIQGLAANTKYYFMGYATNTAGQMAWGGVTGVEFMTIGPAAITTLAATNVQETSVWLNGILTDTGRGSTTVVRAYWGISDAYPGVTGWLGTNDFGLCETGRVTCAASNLVTGQQYVYRYYATNEFGEVWGDVVAFAIGAAGNLTWDGGDPASDLWVSGTNWVDDIGPANPTLGTLTFGDAGITHSNNTVNADWEVGGLTYANTTNCYETDLSGNTLTVLGSIALPEGGIGTSAGARISGGAVRVGSTTVPGQISIPVGNGNRTLTVTNATFVGLLNSMDIGTGGYHGNGYAGIGALDLTAVSGGTLDVRSSITVGSGSIGTGLLDLGSNWTFRVGNWPYSRGIFRVGYTEWTGKTGLVRARPGGGSVSIYASEVLLGCTYNGTGSGVGDVDLSGITGPVFIDATRMTLGYGCNIVIGQYQTWGGACSGSLNLGGTTNLTFNVVDLAVGSVDWGGAPDRLILGAGSGTVDRVFIGTNSGSASYLVTLGTQFRVTAKCRVGETGVISNFIGGAASSGLDLAASASQTLVVKSTVGAAGGIRVVFTANPASAWCVPPAWQAEGVHWGLRWAGNHIADLTALLNGADGVAGTADDKLRWDDSQLTGQFTNQVRIFYDPGIGTVGRPYDMTYVGFYIRGPFPGTVLMIR